MSKSNKFIGLLGVNLLIVFISRYIETYLEVPSPKYNIASKISNIELFFITIFFAPILEEIIYRYPLLRSKYIYLFLFFGILLYFIEINNIYILIFSISLNIASSLLYFFYGIKKLPMILWLLYIISFVVLHIGNYDLSELNKLPWYSWVFLFDAQIILGIILTYVRFNYQFRYTILYHSIYNFIIYLLHIFN